MLCPTTGVGGDLSVAPSTSPLIGSGDEALRVFPRRQLCIYDAILLRAGSGASVSND